MPRIVIDLPAPSPALSPNAHEHWRNRQRAAKVIRSACFYLFKRDLPRDWLKAPIRISAIYRSGKGAYQPKDIQNAIGALKAHVDGLVDAGVVPNDTFEWVKWGEVQILRCITGERPGVRMTVEHA